MDISYIVTSARTQDLVFLSAIELAAAQLLEPYMPDFLLSETTSMSELREAQADGYLWVILAEDIPVGFAHLERLGPDEMHLKEIDVHPAHGRRGLGARLLNVVCDWAESLCCLEITLTTFSDVAWNMPFYARHGFDVISTDNLSTVLKSILEQEARRGLDPVRRVAMRRRLHSGVARNE